MADSFKPDSFAPDAGGDSFQPDEERPKEIGGGYGVLNQIGRGVVDMLNPVPMLKRYASKQGIADVLQYGPAGPVVRAMGEGAKEQAGKAVQSWKAGNKTEAVGHGLAAALPGVGPAAAQVAETAAGEPEQTDKYGNAVVPGRAPNIPRAIGQGTALIGGVVAPGIPGVPEATKAVGEYGEAAKSAIAKGARRTFVPPIDPKLGMKQALKPAANNLRFDADLELGMPEINRSSQIANVPIDDVHKLVNAATASKQRLWSQYEQIVGPQAQRGIDATPIADAMVKAIPEKLARQNPGVVDQVNRAADIYRQPLTIQQLEKYLETSNAELDSYYAKYPAGRGVDVRGDAHVAAKTAEADATRDVLYKALDDSSEGAVPAEIKRRYGAVSNIQRTAQRRINVAERQQPDSLAQQAGKAYGYGEAAYGGLKTLAGHPSGLLDVAKGLTTKQVADFVKEQQTTNALIKRSFENYKGTPPPIQMPPPFRPKALIGQGDMITPPPVDPSFARAVPAMPYPPNPMRALPPASTKIFPPPEGSFVRGVPASLPFDPRFRTY